MAPTVQKRWWRRCRLVFRAFRIAVLLVVLLLVAMGAYLNEVGLPEFLKRPLVEELGKHGIDLRFSRLRLRWYRGVVAENVRFGRATQDTNSPTLALREVQVGLSHAALAHFHFEVTSLTLQDGRLAWPVPETNASPRDLVATNIQAQLRFLTNDQWELDHFTADFAGASLHLAGGVTNASALRDWALFHPGPGAGSNTLTVRRVAEVIDSLKFHEAPELDIQFNGDAQDVESFSGSVSLKAPDAETPWGSVTNGEFLARLAAPKTPGGEPEADFQLHADSAEVPLNIAGRVYRPVEAQNLYAHLHATSGETLTNLIQAQLEATADGVATEWGFSSNASVKMDWLHSMTNAIPLSGLAEIHLTNAQIQQGSAGSVDLVARLNPQSDAAPPATNESWGFWAQLAPFPLDWDCRLRNVHAQVPQRGEYDAKELACAGAWRAPEITVSNFHSELYRGKVDGRATLDVATRYTEFVAKGDFDLLKIAPLLPEITRNLLEQYSWDDPPLGHVSGHATLPAWTNFLANLGEPFQLTVFLDGDVKTGSAAFRGVPFESAFLHYTYSNMVWRIPDLVAVRPEGRLELENENDDRAHSFHFHVKSTIDPRAARHLLPPEAQKALDDVIFTQPPAIEADLWGRWHRPEEIGVQGHVAVTNFALRGESATKFEGDVQYTNGLVSLSRARVDCGGQYATADGLGVDLAGRKGYLTNGFSTLDPAPFFRIVGPKISHVMEPYQFSVPPTVHAYGTIPFEEDVEPDLHFQVDGGPFHWLRFNLDHVTGRVDWVGKHLAFPDTKGEFYGGRMEAAAAFDFVDNRDANFHFDLFVYDANLHALMADVSTKTNRLDGLLNGSLKITKANSGDFKSWNGEGTATLKNGLLWDVPVFGIFSPVLNKLSPGMGDSRADQGAATFTIVNSTIFSDNLEIHAPQILMEYRGTVDFSGRVDAVVEAKLFREIPVIGPVVSAALTPLTMLFQYKVTGTLDDPKMEERYLITKIPRMLLNPFQMLRDLAPSAPATTEPSTNAPPVAPTVPETPGTAP